MPRAPQPDDPAGSTGPVPARVRHARLRARIKALLSARLKRRARPPAPDDASRPNSSWPDSFFDIHSGP
jgi:hypothetical protein